MIPFIPHTFEDHMYYMASSKEIAKLSWKTGKIVYRKRFKKPFFNQYTLVIISDEVFLVSQKNALLVNKHTGETEPYKELSEQLNLKEISTMLGNGVSFMSSIYLTHPQPYTDGGTYGGDGGGGGGGE